MARHRFRHRARRLIAPAALALALLPIPPLQAAAKDVEFPPSETFRALRLTTLICGRDNTASSCEKARTTADSLIDHPLLPASCKDVLWKIRQLARTAPTNSFPRRDPIDAAGQDVVVFCRQQPVKTTEEQNKPSPAPGQGGGFGFGAPPR